MGSLTAPGLCKGLVRQAKVKINTFLNLKLKTPPKEMEHTFPLHTCGLYIVASFYTVQYKKGQKIIITLHWRNLTNATLARCSKSASSVINHTDTM